MTRPIKALAAPPTIAAPDLPADASLPALVGALAAGGSYEDVELAGIELVSTNLLGLAIGPAILTRVRAAKGRWRDLRLRDARCTTCDFANADWTGAVLKRVELVDSRLTGANLSECKFTDVRLTRCKIDNAAFHRSVFGPAQFEECDFRGADFESADLRGVIFRRCDLRGARMAGVRAAGMDLRGSSVEGLQADEQALRGAVIEPVQAADLIGIFGLVVLNRSGDQ